MAARQQILSRAAPASMPAPRAQLLFVGGAGSHLTAHSSVQPSEVNLVLAENHFFPVSDEQNPQGTIVENLYACVQEILQVPGAIACIERLPTFQMLLAGGPASLTTNQIAKQLLENSTDKNKNSPIGAMRHDFSDPTAEEVSDQPDPLESGAGGESAPVRMSAPMLSASKSRVIESSFSWGKISLESLQEYLCRAASGGVDGLRINITSMNRPAPGLKSLFKGSDADSKLERAPPAPVSAPRASRFGGRAAETNASQVAVQSEAPHPLTAIVTVLATAILLAANMKKQGHTGVIDKIAAFTRKVCIWVIAHVHLFGTPAQ